MKRVKHVIAIISDTHCGGFTALMPPSYELDSGTRVSQSLAQEWMWRNWTHYIGKVKAYKRAKADVFVLLNGDLSEGNHHGTPELVSANDEDHVSMAVEVLEPLVALADGIAFVRGTPAHVRNLGALEMGIARALKRYNLIRPDERRLTHDIFRRSIFGLNINAAHHANGGNMLQTKQSAIAGIVSRHLASCAELGEPRADYIIRSHKHKKADTGRAYRTRGIVTPCWQLPTQFAHRIAPDDLPDIGGTFIEIYDDGTHDVVFETYAYTDSSREYQEVELGKATSK